jgi:mannose-6-phosphate isomerase-like protein (cupin superfamily)
MAPAQDAGGEIYYVVSGRLQFKLGDEIHEVGSDTTVRVPPEAVRSVWNHRPPDAELVICSIRLDDPHAYGEIVEGFWTE